MKTKLLAAFIGVCAGLLLAGAYAGLLYAGIRVRPEWVMAGAAALAFAGAVSVFALVALDPPNSSAARAALLLNEDPAKEYVYYFRGPNTLQIGARPDMAVGEMLVRYSDAFKEPPEKMTKSIVVTIKGSPRKPFASATLQQLFAVVKSYNLEHVLLMNDRDEFIGYIPGKRAAKEFAGDKALETIDKYIVKVLLNPSDCGVLRDLGGATHDDTIDERENAMNAQAKIWANEKIAGLVVHQRLKPVGYIAKVDVLRINAGLL